MTDAFRLSVMHSAVSNALQLQALTQSPLNLYLDWQGSQGRCATEKRRVTEGILEMQREELQCDRWDWHFEAQSLTVRAVGGMDLQRRIFRWRVQKPGSAERTEFSERNLFHTYTWSQENRLTNIKHQVKKTSLIYFMHYVNILRSASALLTRKCSFFLHRLALSVNFCRAKYAQ